jgi:hypothetical protein
LAWSIADRITELVTEVLSLAIQRRRPANGNVVFPRGTSDLIQEPIYTPANFTNSLLKLLRFFTSRIDRDKENLSQ